MKVITQTATKAKNGLNFDLKSVFGILSIATRMIPWSLNARPRF